MGKDQDLCDAAYKGSLEGVRKALDAGANPNCTDTPKKGGATPLWYAAIKGNEEIISLLLERGAMVNFRSKEGDTALHGAASGGSMGAAKLLIQHGATALVRNKEGDSPASSALSSGWDAVGRYLTLDWVKDAPKDTGDKDVNVVSNNESAAKYPGRTLVITAVGAKDLIAKDSNGLSDPYMKIYVSNHEFKTKVIHKTLNPEWNETFTVDIKSNTELPRLKFEIYDKDLLSSDYEGGNEVLLAEAPLNLMESNLGRAVRCNVKLLPNAKKFKPVSGHGILEFTLVDNAVLQARTEQEQKFLQEDKQAWAKTQEEEAAKQKEALAKNPTLASNIEKHPEFKEYVYGMDIGKFVKEGDQVMADAYSLMPTDNLLESIWESSIVESLDPSAREATVVHNSADCTEIGDKVAKTKPFRALRKVDTNAKLEDIKVGDLIMTKPKDYIHGASSTIYHLNNRQWVYAEVTEKKDNTITIKYVQKLKDKKEEKTQTLTIDNDTEFKFRIRVVFNPILQTAPPSHPVFETVTWKYDEKDKKRQLPALRGWVKADKSVLSILNTYGESLFGEAVANADLARVNVLLDKGVPPTPDVMGRIPNSGNTIENRVAILKALVSHGGIVDGNFIYAMANMYRDDDKIALKDCVFTDVRASVKAKDDDISLKAEKGELLGDKEKFHKFNWDQDVKICKSFIDSNYFPLCTRESVKPNDYSYEALAPNLVYALWHAGKKELAEYFISKGASVKAAFVSALKYCDLPVIKDLVEKYGLDVNEAHLFKSDSAAPLKIVNEVYSNATFPEFKITEKLGPKAPVYEYLLSKGASTYVAKVTPRDLQGVEKEDELGLAYPKKHPIDAMLDPVLTAPVGGTIDMAPFLPAAVAKVASTLPSHEVDIKTRIKKGTITATGHLTELVATVKYLEYMGRQFPQSIHFRIVLGEDYRDFTPDHIALLSSPVNYKDPADQYGTPSHWFLIRFAWTNKDGSKAQKIKLLEADNTYQDLDKREKRKMFDPFCIDVGKEYYKSWDVPKRLPEEEIAKRKDEFEKFRKSRKQW